MSVKITFSPFVQVRRSAQSLVNGEEILADVLAHEVELIEAAERGIPPVAAVSEHLKKKFPEDVEAATVRQFIGSAVKAVLTKNGFEVAQTGIRLPRGSVFRTGAVYRKKTDITDKRKEAVRDALANMVKGMSLAEKRLLLDVVQTALGEV